MRRFASAIASTLIAVAALLAPPSGVPASYAGEGATVLIYHRFGERGLPSTNIRLEQFEAHLAEIATGAYNVLPLTDIVTAFEADTPLPERTLAITIDDAFLSVYTEAWPRLRDAGLPFALFVATGPIDNQTAGYMSWDHLREMVAGGVTIGQHTVSHLRMHELSRAENAAEIETARPDSRPSSASRRNSSPTHSASTGRPAAISSRRLGSAPPSANSPASPTAAPIALPCRASP